MSGLRARKKQRARAEIVCAAKKLFENNGFQNTSMEEIAAEAQVGVGTLYNYFASKDGLLLALFADATDQMLARGAAVTGPGLDPVEAVVALLEMYLEMGRIFAKPVFREVLAASLTAPPEVGRAFARMDMRLVAQLAALLAALKERGWIDPQIPCGDAAFLLYGAVMGALLTYLVVPSATLDDARDLVRRQVALVFVGLEPR